MSDAAPDLAPRRWDGDHLIIGAGVSSRPGHIDLAANATGAPGYRASQDLRSMPTSGAADRVAEGSASRSRDTIGEIFGNLLDAGSADDSARKRRRLDHVREKDGWAVLFCSTFAAQSVAAIVRQHWTTYGAIIPVDYEVAEARALIDALRQRLPNSQGPISQRPEVATADDSPMRSCGRPGLAASGPAVIFADSRGSFTGYRAPVCSTRHARLYRRYDDPARQHLRPGGAR
jgi:phosphoglucomutase